METQGYNPQAKVKEEFPEKELVEIQTSNLSDLKSKVMVIRMFKELSKKCKELYGNYKELSGNYITLKKDI